MTFSSFEVVFFTAGFLVPGFIWSAILAMLVPARDRPGESRWIEFLTLSCINHGIWSWALWPVFSTNALDTHPWWSGLLLSVIIFVSPVGFGMLHGWLHQHGYVARLLKRLRLRGINAIPTAWDFQFGKQQPSWVLVTLKDGSTVCGLYGTGSFAGSVAGCRDLFVEQQFRLLPTEAEEWAPVEDSGGVLVQADQIALIEFREFME